MAKTPHRQHPLFILIPRHIIIPLARPHEPTILEPINLDLNLLINQDELVTHHALLIQSSRNLIICYQVIIALSFGTDFCGCLLVGADTDFGHSFYVQFGCPIGLRVGRFRPILWPYCSHLYFSPWCLLPKNHLITLKHLMNILNDIRISKPLQRVPLQHLH